MTPERVPNESILADGLPSKRRYLMNSISESFGSGHRSSATMRSRRVR
jgi:hypothetical protein